MLDMDSQDSSSQADRRRRRRKKRLDEESIDSVSTISRAVEEADTCRDTAEPSEQRRDDRDKHMTVEDSGIVKIKKKKLKKIKEASQDDVEGTTDLKPRRKKKKKSSDSVSSSEEFNGSADTKRAKKKRDRRKLTGSQALLREDFYSDPQLATTLQGLEEDMYSLAGEAADSAILSPYPLVPNIPTSQPVAKVSLINNYLDV